MQQNFVRKLATKIKFVYTVRLLLEAYAARY